MTNITASCQHLNQPTPVKEPLVNLPIGPLNSVKPYPLQLYATRDKQRFFIRTDVNLFFNKQKFNILTNDVSESGLSLSLPAKVDIEIGTRVTLEFIRWQKLTKKVKLDSIPFIVRNKHYLSDKTHYGLQRDSRACAGSINSFFTTAIKLNKEQLVEENLNIQISQESKVFTSLLTPKLNSIPIYLGTDKQAKRILQAVATTDNNLARDKQGLWLAIQNSITPISELIKACTDNKSSYISFGLYCYQDSKDTWQINIEQALENSAEKTMFINQALLSEQHYFFHCALAPLSSGAEAKEKDLYQQLLQLRSHSQHKVKQIREVLQSLFAVGELTDITDIISAVYR